MNNPAAPIATAKRWYEIRNEANKPAEVLIYDDIGTQVDWWTGETTGVGAEGFINDIKALGDGREIVVGVNSSGGNVWDGLAIYNFLQARTGKTRTRNDGIAASIASVVLLGGKDGVEVAEASQTMVHDPTLFIREQVGIGELAKIIHALEAGKKAILAVYTKKTKRTEAELSRMMTEETWMTGKEARALGFADSISGQIPIFNSFDLSRFTRVPEALKKRLNNKTAVQTAGKHQQNMERTKIIALLTKARQAVDEKATDEQLQAQWDAHLETLLGGKIDDKGGKDDAEGAAAMANIHAELKALREKGEAERKLRITREVDDLVTEGRLMVNEKDKALVRAINDETYLSELKTRPVNKPGPESGPVIDLVSASLSDVLKHLRSGNVTASTERSSLMRKNHDKIVAAWHDRQIGLDTTYKLRNEGTNTIDSTLKQDVLYDQALKAFAKILAGLNAFSTKFENVPLRGSAKLQVPYIALQGTASTAWNASNGYVGGDTATDNREVTIDKRYYQAIRFTMDEFNRQPFLLLAEHMVNNGQRLAYDVWLDLLGAVTIANYATTPPFAATVSQFDSDDLADLEKAANDAQWPIPGRSLFLNSAFDNQLKKDNALKGALNSGTNSVTSRGALEQMLYGFNYVMNPNIPANSEDLAGFICHKSALLVATAPIAPNEDVVRAGLTYNILTDPDLGISMEVKRFGQPQMDRAFHIIECNWGKAAGVETALIRIRSSAGS